MIKILIAEDEGIERKYLKKLLMNYFSYRIEIIGECNNGVDATEKSLLLRPDIIIMDIHMPKKDGLQASKVIKQHLPDTEIIILTAYDYFDYAKEAIRIGVRDYLVKPYKDEKFCAVMESLIEKINTNRTKKQEIQTWKMQLKQYNKIMEKEIVFGVITGNLSSVQNIQQYLHQKGLVDDYLRCIVIHTDYEFIPSENIITVIKNKFKFHTHDVIGYSFLKDIILILFGQQDNEGLLVPLQEVEKYLKETKKIQCSIGLGELYQGIENIKQSYDEAVISVDKQDENKKISKHDKVINILYQTEKEIFKCIMKDDTVQVVQELQHFAKLLKEKNEDRIQNMKNYFIQLCIVLNKNISEFFCGNIVLKEIQVIHQEIQKLNTQEQLIFYVENYLYDLIKSVNKNKQTQNEKVVQLVKEYIKKNYQYNIALTDVANQFEISSYHLSRVFKKIEGINFKDYMVKIRMEEAKHLIRESRKSVAEAALAVGYTDASYFGKVFKKYTGVSPKQYANM